LKEIYKAIATEVSVDCGGSPTATGRRTPTGRAARPTPPRSGRARRHIAGTLNVFHDADEVLVLLRVAVGAGVGEVERLPQLGAVDGRHHRTGGGGPNPT